MSVKKAEISKVMSFLAKRSAAKRTSSYYSNLGKKNKGKKQSASHIKKRISKALKTRRQKRVLVT